MIRPLVFLLLLLLFRSAAADVIVHPGVQVHTANSQYLLSIFSMQTRTWPDGKPIRVFVFPSSTATHSRFVKQSLKIFPYQLRNIWDRSVFSGAGQSPRVVDSLDEMMQRVSSVEGAIGYVSHEVKGESDVKVLEVQ